MSHNIMLDLNLDPKKKKRIPKRFKEYALKQLKEREYNKRRNAKQGS